MHFKLISLYITHVYIIYNIKYLLVICPLVTNFLAPPLETTNIVTKGSLPLNSTYYLHDVLCVPTFKVNLMSVSCLIRGLNCSVTFFPYWCILQDLATRRMISLGKQRDRLYYLVAIATKKSMVQPTPPLHRPAYNLTISSTDRWHKRLGHISPHC
jgi:hypothetical protein